MWIVIGEIVTYIGIFIFLLGGLVLTAFALPGVWLIWLVILGTGIIKGLEIIPLWFIIVTFVVSVVISIVDNFIIAYEAKRYGAGRWGIVGAVAGAILGLLFGGIVGLLIGPFLGAFALEYFFAKKNSDDAFRSGVGSALGVVLAIVVKLGLCILMIIGYVYHYIF